MDEGFGQLHVADCESVDLVPGSHGRRSACPDGSRRAHHCDKGQGVSAYRSRRAHGAAGRNGTSIQYGVPWTTNETRTLVSLSLTGFPSSTQLSPWASIVPLTFSGTAFGRSTLSVTVEATDA